MEERKFQKAYDNPYRVLAAHIVANYPPTLVQRVLSDSSFIKSLIAREARQLDMSGAFLDCIDQEIISQGKLRRKNAYLKKLGEFYYSELDVSRLRKEVRTFAEELGVQLQNQMN